MVEFAHKVSTVQGLHARPVAEICAVARDSASTIMVSVNGNQANAQDLLGLMALNAQMGDVLHVTVCGEDEQAAARRVQKILQSMV